MVADHGHPHYYKPLRPKQRRTVVKVTLKPVIALSDRQLSYYCTMAPKSKRYVHNAKRDTNKKHGSWLKKKKTPSRRQKESQLRKAYEKLKKELKAEEKAEQTPTSPIEGDDIP